MTTVNAQVAASGDDGWEKVDTTIDIAGSTVGILSNGNMWGCFRFAGITVPQGQTITSATLELYVVSTTNDDLVADFYAQAADDAALITTASTNISTRPRSTAKTSVNATSIAAGGSVWHPVDMTAPFQEVFNRAGWVSGNAAAAILDALPGILFACRAWDHGSSTGAKLTIVYTTGGGLPLKQTYYARQRRA